MAEKRKIPLYKYSAISFARGWGDFGESRAVDESMKRLERFTKQELISKWHKVLTILTSYFDLRAAYDGLISALDFLRFGRRDRRRRKTAMNEQVCGKCRHHVKEGEEWYCDNMDGVCYLDWTEYGDSCDDWEGRQ